ncbi:S-adenosyl-L-methionine-dependent methyltransferase [Tricladium varicosporioides]|nr:S-adenosyl-L-methionine-dependent methyltransferase [Hymenoscyphus varicosporioides]
MLHISSLLNATPGVQPVGDASNITINDNDTNGNIPDENDSAFGGSLLGTEADSLEESITDYPYENGRRYHAFKDGEYWGPNDDSANESHDVAHHLYLLTLDGKLHLAPIAQPHNILDVGCGTGIWAIEMADAYPCAHVVGTDLSPTQPMFVPPNCAFEIEDFNCPWTYPIDHFDFIHVRELFGSVFDWDDFLLQAFEHMKSGGYVEIVEHSVCPVSDDSTVNEESFFTLWGKTVVELGENIGKTFEIWKDGKAKLKTAGFEDIVETRFKWPVNGWPSPEFRTCGNDGNMSWKKLRELGIWNQVRLHDGIEGLMLRLLTKDKMWSYEEAQIFMGKMRKEIKNVNTHAYIDVSIVYGRKPGGRNLSALSQENPSLAISKNWPFENVIPEGYQGVIT